VKTPVRSALIVKSSLLPKVLDGLGAVKKAHSRTHFDDEIRPDFADSLALDAALEKGHEQENRWDYLVGHETSSKVVGVEPHSAKGDQISTVIAKRKAAIVQLRTHLANGAYVASWLWVASGRVFFADTEKARIRLDQNGIKFVGRKILKRHLP
jgi:hypothetical protein